MNFRNLFKSKIENKAPVGVPYETVKMLNSYTPYVMADVGSIYGNLLIRSCIDTVAKHGAKLKAKVKGPNSSYKKRLQYLLEHQPNRYMSAFDFLYKVISTYLTNNNAFIFVNYLNENYIEGLYPVVYERIEFLEYNNGLYCKFFFKSGTAPVILPYDELIHLRRHFNGEDLTGETQAEVLSPVMQLLKSFVEGCVNAVKATSMLRGYLRVVNSISPESLKKYKDSFTASYMSNSSDGIGALDARAEFHELKIEPKTVDSKNLELASKQIYTYYGLSEAILTGNYTEEKYSAFYNSTIEPIAIQFSDEFTNKLFSPEEITRGCEIEFSSLRLIFANNSTKANLLKEMMPLGLFTFNEARKLFELDEVEGGDKRLVSLNYVNADKQDRYQGVDGGKDEKTDNENDTKEE